MLKQKTCEHIRSIEAVKTSKSNVCDECIKNGDSWLHLRVCQSCGATLCCDQSPNKHATKHAAQTLHPVISSSEPNEHWLWCYPDEQFYPLSNSK